MIGIVDTYILAFTKLRTRRIRTILTIVTSGLLFSCVVAALLLSQGVFHSINQFNKLGFGQRYIVQATPTTPIVAFYDSQSAKQSVEARATQLYTQTVAAKTQEAKKLGIAYDSSSDEKPLQTFSGPNDTTSTTLNGATPTAQQALSEYFAANPAPGAQSLKAISAKYHPTAFYSASSVSVGGSFVTMRSGEENFSTEASSSSTTTSQSIQNDVLQNGSLEFASESLVQPFLLPNARSLTKNSAAIPIALPYTAAERDLGLTPLPGTASSSQKLARIQQVYKQAASIRFYGCYRNGTSMSQIQSAVTTASEIAANKNNKNYQKPNLIYGLPAANLCGQAPVASDTRTADEKSMDQKQAQFNAMFGINTTPDQLKMPFQVVGIIPAQQDKASSDSAAGILQSLVGSSLSGNAAIPQELYNELPTPLRTQYTSVLTKGDALSAGNTAPSYYAEFSNATDARNFINDASCSPQAVSCSGATPFVLSAFGSNSIALKDLRQKISGALRYGAGIVIVLASIIMTTTLGRMLADGRRETAVFRATGAKRIDISAVYGLYTVILSLLVAAFALVLGTGVARIVDNYYWRTVTIQAQLAYGGSDPHLRFRLFSMTASILLVAALAVAVGIVSVLLPLIRNVRRNPIQDMRDE